MKFILVSFCFSWIVFFNISSSYSLEEEIRVDRDKFHGRENKALLLLQDYISSLTSDDTSLGLKTRISKKVAAILGEGKGVGGFKTKRKASEHEKKVMVQALDLAYRFYPLEDNNFFTSYSADPQIKRHQAILWGLSKTISIKTAQRMFEQEKRLGGISTEKYKELCKEPKSPERDDKIDHNNDEFFSWQVHRRITSFQICGNFDKVQQRYNDLIIDKDGLYATVSALIANANLTGYDSALESTLTLLNLLASKSDFLKENLAKTISSRESRGTISEDLISLSLNTKPLGIYSGSIFNVVSIYQYNPDLGKTTIAIRRKGGAKAKLGSGIETAISGLGGIDYDIVFQIGFSDGAPYLLRPHGWTDPDATGSYDKSHKINAGIFGSREGATITGQAFNAMGGSHDVITHGGVASPNNMPLNLPNRNLEPNEHYSFMSVVTEGSKGVVTLHNLGGDFVNQDLLNLAALFGKDLTVGDLFLLMHYSPLISENPHFLNLLVQWLG